MRKKAIPKPQKLPHKLPAIATFLFFRCKFHLVHSYFRIVYFVNQGRGDWKTISVAHFDLTKCPKMSHFNKSHT